MKPMRTYILGVDPGLDGATVAVEPSAHRLSYFPHSELGRHNSYLSGETYITAARKLVYEIMEEIRVSPGISLHNTVIMEAAAVLGRQSGQRTVGVNWGVIKACWDILGFNILVVPANVWKPVMVGKKASREYGKNSSCITAEKLGYIIPSHRPAGKKLHDGVADAALIAEYGGRKFGL